MKPLTPFVGGMAANLLVASALIAQGPAAPGPSYLLKPARVFDAASSRTREGVVVLVTGHHIAAVGAPDDVRVPPGTAVVDLPGTTLLPGLIDAHSHVFLHPYNETPWNDQVMKETLAYRTILAVRHCEATLMAGFTALRDLGTEGAEYADVVGPAGHQRRPDSRTTAPGGHQGHRGHGQLRPWPARIRHQLRAAQRRGRSQRRRPHVVGGPRPDRSRRGRRETVRGLPARPRRVDRADADARGDDGGRAGSGERRPAGVGPCVPPRGHAPCGAGRRTDDRTRIRRDRRRLHADGRTRHGLVRHAGGAGSDGDLQPGLHARGVETDAIDGAGPAGVPAGAQARASRSASAPTSASSRTAPTPASSS